MSSQHPYHQLELFWIKNQTNHRFPFRSVQLSPACNKTKHQKFKPAKHQSAQLSRCATNNSSLSVTAQKKPEPSLSIWQNCSAPLSVPRNYQKSTSIQNMSALRKRITFKFLFFPLHFHKKRKKAAPIHHHISINRTSNETTVIASPPPENLPGQPTTCNTVWQQAMTAWQKFSKVTGNQIRQPKVILSVCFPHQYALTIICTFVNEP